MLMYVIPTNAHRTNVVPWVHNGVESGRMDEPRDIPLAPPRPRPISQTIRKNNSKLLILPSKRGLLSAVLICRRKRVWNAVPINQANPKDNNATPGIQLHPLVDDKYIAPNAARI